MIRQWSFPDPADTYYDAITGAHLNPPSGSPSHPKTRSTPDDFLRRLEDTLDARRPQPEAPFTHLDVSAWAERRNAPVIAWRRQTPRGSGPGEQLLHRGSRHPQ